jgi:ParB family chromosome partitioning protein
VVPNAPATTPTEGGEAVAGPEGSRPGAAGLLARVRVDAVRPGPYQARQGVDPARLEELAATVRAHGVLQPVVVRPRPEGFELVAGERRWRAAQLAGLETIPAVVRELSDAEAAELALVENLQREDLHFFEEAEGYRRLMEEFGLSQEEVAARLGRAQPTVANKLRLLRLEPEVRERVVALGLTERHARLLLRLEGAAARLEAAEAFARRELTVRQAEAWVARRLEGTDVREAAPPPAWPEAATLREQVAAALAPWRAAGFRVEVRERAVADGWEVRIRVRGSEPGGRTERRRA